MMVVGGKKRGWRFLFFHPALLLLLVGPLVAQSAYYSSPFFNMLKRDPLDERLEMLKRNSLNLSKKNIPEDCQGRYDTGLYSRLESVCEDCYNLYKLPEVHQMCRQDCFGTVNFQNCLQMLLLPPEDYLNMASIIG